jgi:hypothetical protein
MDNAVPPDRYGNYFPPFPLFLCARVFFSSFKFIRAEKEIQEKGMFMLFVLVGRAR